MQFTKVATFSIPQSIRGCERRFNQATCFRRLFDGMLHPEAAWQINFFLSIFPVANLGREARNSTYFGVMKGSRFSLQCRMTDSSVSLPIPSVTMKTLMTSPRISSGIPIATTSPIPLNSWSVFSISLGLTRSPPVFIKSSFLATKYRYPSLSFRNKSPVYSRVSP